MENIVYGIKIAGGIIGAFLGGIIGGMDGLLNALLLFVVIDYITGIVVAVIEKRLSSQVGFKGLAKKVFIFALVAIGHVIDVNVIGSGSTLRTAVIMFYLANESLSILENAAKTGLPIPPKLKAILLQLKERESNEND